MNTEPKILVIDDNVELAENIQEILEGEGIDVTVADGGSAALELLVSGNFSLVVTDMKMPGMNGLEVIRYIKERWPQLPVVIMTAYAQDELLDEARREGAIRIISKPVDFEHLTDYVRRFSSGATPVLIVEDDPALRSNLAELLQDVDGVVPYPVRDASEARKVAKEAPPRAAVIDLRLPDGDGMALGADLRLALGDEKLPILYITGFAHDFRDTLESVLTTDGIKLLEKPFDAGRLLDLVREMV